MYNDPTCVGYIAELATGREAPTFYEQLKLEKSGYMGRRQPASPIVMTPYKSKTSYSQSFLQERVPALYLSPGFDPPQSFYSLSYLIEPVHHVLTRWHASRPTYNHPIHSVSLFSYLSSPYSINCELMCHDLIICLYIYVYFSTRLFTYLPPDLPPYLSGHHSP